MKKLFLLIFLITSVIVSAKTLVSSNSLSPPQLRDAKLMPQLQMLQMLVAEITPIDVGLFERDVSYSVSFENYQLVMPDKDIGFTNNFQIIENKNCASAFFEKSNVLLQAMSPKCRAVMQSFSFDNLILPPAASSIIQAVSPNCRDVLSAA
jgi:hypothetical protein